MRTLIYIVLAALALIGVVFGGVALVTKTYANAGVNMPWYISNSAYISSMYAVNPTVTAKAFNTPTSYAISNNPASPGSLPAGFTTTPVLKYTAYASFKADVGSGAISPAFKWLMYDNESWNATPTAEQNDPWSYMKAFVQLAHDHGYNVICAPARDLGNVATSVHPAESGESLDHWFVRTGIAQTAALAGADIIHIQTQADTLKPASFSYLWKASTMQVEAAVRPFPPMSAGVSTAYGTAADMDAATHLAGASGYWLNVPDNDATKATQFLALQEG